MPDRAPSIARRSWIATGVAVGLAVAAPFGCDDGGGATPGDPAITGGPTPTTGNGDSGGDTHHDDDSEADDGDTASGSDEASTSDDGGPVTCQSPEVACGALCADLSTDPSNCGLCGRTCLIANAEAGCENGECTLLSCEQGYSDCDNQLANGCEAPVDCSGGPCATACGSTGTATCDDACAAVCLPPAETCNAADDDCNGACDEGAMEGCRIGVNRSYSPSLGHFYTTDLAEAQSGDFNLEAADFYHLYVEGIDGLVPLYRCLKGNGRRLYTSATDCEGLGAVELTVGFMAPDERCGSAPLYRVWQPTSDSHFYTTSATERDNATANLGYQDQGVTGYIWTAP